MMILMRTMCLVLCLFSSTLWASVGKVSLLKGDAFVVRGTQKSALQTNAPLEEKDVVSTAKEAQIQLMFDDKTVITLGSDSEFKIEEYLSDATSPKAKFKFNQGSFKTITGKIGKAAPENFILETKTATIGIRGTWIRGKIEADGDTIGCLRGRIFVRSLRGDKVIEVIEGRKIFVGFDKDPTDPLPIGDGDFSNQDFRENAQRRGSGLGDYDSFGYWDRDGYGGIDRGINEMPLFGDFVDPNSQVTPPAYLTTLIGTNNTYHYEGLITGTVAGNDPGAIINDGTNIISMSADFSSSTVSGSVTFYSPSAAVPAPGPVYWNHTIVSGTLSPTGFSGQLQPISAPATGTISGSFIGPTADSVSGSFTAITFPAGNTATGTFTAPKIP